MLTLLSPKCLFTYDNLCLLSSMQNYMLILVACQSLCERYLSLIRRVVLHCDCRIRKGYPYEARVITRILPAFLMDFFPPQDVMNKVIAEFLSCQQPHPELMATVVFQVRTFTDNNNTNN